MKLRCILAALLGLTLAGCNKDNGMSQAEKDEILIEDYLADNNITAEEHESGLYFRIDDAGTGPMPTINDEVEVRYKGYLLDGTVFDQTQGNSTIEFPLANLIPAWQIGIPLISSGGSITLFSPSSLAYGNRQVGSIPANSVLVFEIDLVSFK